MVFKHEAILSKHSCQSQDHPVHSDSETGEFMVSDSKKSPSFVITTLKPIGIE